MVFLGILGFAAIMSFIAFRSSFFGLKFMAGMVWLVVFMYLKSNPPAGITEGSVVHSSLLIIAVGFAFMVMITGLGEGTSRTQRNSDGSEVTREGRFSFRLPDWLKDGNSPEVRRHKTEQDIAEYRAKVHQALNHPKRER